MHVKRLSLFPDQFAVEEGMEEIEEIRSLTIRVIEMGELP